MSTRRVPESYLGLSPLRITALVLTRLSSSEVVELNRCSFLATRGQSRFSLLIESLAQRHLSGTAAMYSAIAASTAEVDIYSAGFFIHRGTAFVLYRLVSILDPGGTIYPTPRHVKSFSRVTWRRVRGEAVTALLLPPHQLTPVTGSLKAFIRYPQGNPDDSGLSSCSRR